MNRKIAALVLVIILIANLVLFAVGMISNLLFWILILVIGLISYFGFRNGKINK
ncbi:MAG: hypothetical protein KKE20_00050 [Nanoarchaeota archaeon]|nr:hypothetical protein [Nanoarchaeota archaeon]